MVMKFWVLLSLKAGAVRGDHYLSVTVREPSGKVLPFRDAMPVTFTDETKGTNIVMEAPFQPPGGYGEYWFDVYWDAEPLTSMSMTLATRADHEAHETKLAKQSQTPQEEPEQ
jgi:hypothetical protein